MIDGQIKAARYRARTGAVKVLRDEAIFAGTGHPRDWPELIGQTEAVTQVQAACLSAYRRRTRLDHTLFASGLHGIGKTSLAKLIAWEMSAGLVEMSGKVSVDEARAVLQHMDDGDVLFLDEIHMLVSGGKAGAEWLLPLLQNGVLLTAKGGRGGSEGHDPRRDNGPSEAAGDHHQPVQAPSGPPAVHRRGRRPDRAAPRSQAGVRPD